MRIQYFFSTCACVVKWLHENYIQIKKIPTISIKKQILLKHNLLKPPKFIQTILFNYNIPKTMKKTNKK